MSTVFWPPPHPPPRRRPSRCSTSVHAQLKRGYSAVLSMHSGGWVDRAADQLWPCRIGRPPSDSSPMAARPPCISCAAHNGHRDHQLSRRESGASLNGGAAVPPSRIGCAAADYTAARFLADFTSMTQNSHTTTTHEQRDCPASFARPPCFSKAASKLRRVGLHTTSVGRVAYRHLSQSANLSVIALTRTAVRPPQYLTLLLSIVIYTRFFETFVELVYIQ